MLVWHSFYFCLWVAYCFYGDGLFFSCCCVFFSHCFRFCHTASIPLTLLFILHCCNSSRSLHIVASCTIASHVALFTHCYFCILLFLNVVTLFFSHCCINFFTLLCQLFSRCCFTHPVLLPLLYSSCCFILLTMLFLFYSCCCFCCFCTNTLLFSYSKYLPAHQDVVFLHCCAFVSFVNMVIDKTNNQTICKLELGARTQKVHFSPLFFHFFGFFIFHSFCVVFCFFFLFFLVGF